MVTDRPDTQSFPTKDDAMNPLRELSKAGQSPWLDFVDRPLIASGRLKAMIETDGLKGMTSNPAIFEKAITSAIDYRHALTQFAEHRNYPPMAIYEHLAIADIQHAADALLPVYHETAKRDGYISLEVSPYLAHDTTGTVAEARRLWQAVNRPNVMIKVPGTPEGVPAIRTLISEGISINVTLLFAVDCYKDVAEAFLAGLEDRAAQGSDLSKVASVASFFISRIDNVVDRELQSRVDHGDIALRAHLGKTAIACAKLAYRHYQSLTATPRWQALAERGAQTQRLLWASTSVKNPQYPDTLYVETLIGPDTVNTMPPATMDAFRDHGRVNAHAITEHVREAELTLQAVAQSGISLDAITTELVADGVRQFAGAFDQLLGAVEKQRAALHPVNLMRIEANADMTTAIVAKTQEFQTSGLLRKIWASDPTVWTNQGEQNWTGWLDIVHREHAHIGTLLHYAKTIRAAGYRHVVLLGMGGSSLGPEVLATVFGKQPNHPEFLMLDSTDPAQIRALDAKLDLKTTHFIVSSKSGSTLEPNIMLAYYRTRMIETVGEAAWGQHFTAVTDPGSALEQQAMAQHFAHIMHGVPSIGGRYSVLSKFGLVPAAAIGIDIEKLLANAADMVIGAGPDVPVSLNAAAQLGILLGTAATQFRRDKITIIASPGITDLGAWLEQLIAESTGKQGRGLIPIDGEPLGTVAQYGDDRVMVHLALAGETDARQDGELDALARAGHPVVRIRVNDRLSLGQEFFRWEMATAIAGAIIGINPFDQPDVEASKIKTRGLTDGFEKTGALEAPPSIFEGDGISLYADAANSARLGSHETLAAYLKAHFQAAKPGDYCALLAYVDHNQTQTEHLTHMRRMIRDQLRIATCVGFGPRFLHSTGQAYKGGPNSGIFLQITSHDAHDLPVPGHRYSFGVVKAAQAMGDLGVLEARGRRALRVHLHHLDAGMKTLKIAIEQALS
jgi:transaldolase/glucose-6-phosphate isomerase